jgi:hypothetical protein
MDDQTRNASQKGAQKYFAKALQDDSLAKEIARKERAVTAAKTARLRALRLAKEAADKEQADKLAAQETSAVFSPPRKRRPAGKSAGVVRMRY